MLNVKGAELTGRRLISNKFIEIDRTVTLELPGDMEGWLDKNSLARFVVEVVEQLDTSEIEGASHWRWQCALSSQNDVGFVVLLLRQGHLCQSRDREGDL